MGFDCGLFFEYGFDDFSDARQLCFVFGSALPVGFVPFLIQFLLLLFAGGEYVDADGDVAEDGDDEGYDCVD